MAFITRDEVLEFLGSTNLENEAVLDASILAAEEHIKRVCGRSFETATATATIRSFKYNAPDFLLVDDFTQETGLAPQLQHRTFGNVSSPLLQTIYTIDPDFLIADILEAQDGFDFRSVIEQGRIHVSAAWGWPEVPAPIKEATRLLTARLFRRKRTSTGQLGFAAGGEVGDLSYITRNDPDISSLLQGYIKYTI